MRCCGDAMLHASVRSVVVPVCCGRHEVSLRYLPVLSVGCFFYWMDVSVVTVGSLCMRFIMLAIGF